MTSLGGEHLEIEVKFFLSDKDVFRTKLLGAGAAEVVPRTYERNVRFDTPAEGLRSQGKLLRLRQDASTRLTFKGATAEDLASEARVREELEVSVENFKTMAAILKRVGFQPVQIYEKYRQTFQMGDVEIVIDEMPYGDFVELEGDDQELLAAADKLGLNWDQRILANYLALMVKFAEFYNLSFSDVTFENFAGFDISFAELVDKNGISWINAR